MRAAFLIGTLALVVIPFFDGDLRAPRAFARIGAVAGGVA